MKPLLERLTDGEVLVGDGAMGTMLLARGLESGASPESFSLNRPEVLQEIARLYLEAGADIIQTNTFGGCPLKLAMYGLDDQAEEINRAAAAAVRSAVNDRALVSGSCGPSGAMLKPYGDTEPEEMYSAFRRQMEALIGAGVDVICIETMTAAEEAALAIKAAKDVKGDIPVMATMTFDATPRGYFTIMGVTVEQAAAELTNAGADVIGSNCGNGSAPMIKIARLFRASTDRPLLIQPNAGLPETRDGELIYSETPEFMAEKARELIAAGVSIIGGCCGTTPEHIRALRETVDSMK